MVPDNALAVCNGAAFDLDLQDSPPDVILPDGGHTHGISKTRHLFENEETGVNAQDFTQQLDLAEGVFWIPCFTKWMWWQVKDARGRHSR